MGKYLAALPVMLFPYSLLAAIACLYSPQIMETVFGNNGYLLLLSVLAFGLLAWLFALALAIYLLLKKGIALQTAKLAMIVKLVQIPAYAAIFILGLAFSLTIFGIGFVAFFFIADCITIVMTGLIGTAASVRAYLTGQLPLKRAILFALLQFVFVVDIAAAIAQYCVLHTTAKQAVA